MIDLSEHTDEQFKDWENSLLEHLARWEGDLSEFEAQLYQNATILPVLLSRALLSQDSDRADTLVDRELTDQFGMFAARTQFFSRHWNEWQNRLADGEDDALHYSRTNQFHLFSALYVQQLEGPLQYELAVIVDLVDSLEEGEGDWREVLEENQYFHQVLDAAIDSIEAIQPSKGRRHARIMFKILAQDEDFFEEIYESLGHSVSASVFPTARRLRNSFAHADYRLDHADASENHDFNVILGLGEGEERETLPAAVNFISDQWTLMQFLGVGVTMGVAKLCLEAGRIDHFVTPIESYTHGFPPRGPGSGARELRDAYD